MTSVIESPVAQGYTGDTIKKYISGGNMDKFVRNFIIVSIVYLGISSVLGVGMLSNPSLMSLKFVHSHLNMLGWVSMMIYGVGYHILPRFAGRPLKHPKMGEFQFWAANVGLVGMLLSYAIGLYQPSQFDQYIAASFGGIEVISIGLFIYNMLATLLPKTTS